MSLSVASDVAIDDSDVSGRSVLERATTILSCFARGVTSCTLKELCDRTGLPKSTVHRFAERLVEMGWLERIDGEYSIGIGLYEIGNLANRYYRLRTVALPHLQQLAVTTKCAAQLAVLAGDEVEYLEIVPYRNFHPPSWEGGRMPAYCTALGRAVLAFASPAELAAALDIPRIRRTPYTTVTNAALRDEFDRIRKTGVSIDGEESFRGLSCVAAPIRGTGRAIAAISACAPSVPFDTEQIGLHVRRSAHAIWAGLSRAAASRPPRRMTVVG
jgi:DNA-binding IclR family transcriptional regulator